MTNAAVGYLGHGKGILGGRSLRPDAIQVSTDFTEATHRGQGDGESESHCCAISPAKGVVFSTCPFFGFLSANIPRTRRFFIVICWAADSEAQGHTEWMCAKVGAPCHAKAAASRRFRPNDFDCVIAILSTR